jgi:CDP-diacylglycerol--serine O-phosphatidyltransferase
MDSPVPLDALPHAPEPVRAPSRWRLAAPSIVTLGNATCGFVAVVLLLGAVAQGPPTPAAIAPAAWAILAGWIFDMADGMVARLLRATSALGMQLDSLCDAVTFGFAPAILVAVAGGLSWGACLAGVVYLWAVLIRLARFNTEADDDGDHMDFKGLPSVAAAAIVAALVATAAHPAGLVGLPDGLAPAVAVALTAALPWLAVATAALMLSPWRYADAPKHYARRVLPRWHLAAFLAAAIVIGPAPFLFGYFTLYALIGAARGAVRP